MFEIETEIKITPKLAKDFRAAWFNYNRVKPIKRTRKRQIDKAKHMMDWHNHTSYECHNDGKNRQESLRGGRNET